MPEPEFWAHGRGALTPIDAWCYEEWCRNTKQDPDSLDAVLGFEDLFDETDEDQYRLFT